MMRKKMLLPFNKASKIMFLLLLQVFQLRLYKFRDRPRKEQVTQVYVEKNGF